MNYCYPDVFVVTQRRHCENTKKRSVLSIKDSAEVTRILYRKHMMVYDNVPASSASVDVIF